MVSGIEDMVFQHEDLAVWFQGPREARFQKPCVVESLCLYVFLGPWSWQELVGVAGMGLGCSGALRMGNPLGSIKL